MSDSRLDLTPYEKFLRESLEDEKKKLGQLNEQLSKAGRLRKIHIKRQLDMVNQNIQLLSRDLKNYESGLHWLREPSKERDEIAEHLKPVPIEAIMAQAPKPATPPQTARAAPTVGTGPPSAAPPVGRPPTVGQPIGSKSQSDVQRPSTPSPQQAPRVGTPVVGKPVGTPVVGKPIGTPVGKPTPQQVTQAQPATTSQPETKAEQAQQAQSGESSQTQAASRVSAPMVGKPIGTPTKQAPRVGTPISSQGQPPKKEEEQQKDSASASTEEKPQEEKQDAEKDQASDSASKAQSS
jgi:hypothetical protein